MSDRNLRRGTRKDYVKMAEGDDVNNNNKSDESACDLLEQQQHGSGSGNDVVGNDIATSNCEQDGFMNVSDEELEEMGKRLEVLKMQEEKFKRDQKFRRLSEETRRVERSLRDFREKEKKNKKEVSKIDVKDLRGIDEVMKKADKHLERKLGLKKKNSSSKTKNKCESSTEESDTEQESCCDGERSSSSDVDRSQERSKRKTVKKKGKRTSRKDLKSESDSCSSDSDASESDADSSSSGDIKRKSGRKGEKKSSKKKSKGKKSGKSQKLTSKVKYPQRWPHSYLGQQFVNQNKKYEELSIAEFCAGYSSILRKTKGKIVKFRLEHLEEIMYLTTRYFWRNVLNYHAAVLLEIERGNLKWGDSFQHLRDTTLAGNFINVRGNGASSSHGGKFQPKVSEESGGGRVLFCRNFQRGTCTHARDHQGMYDGESRFLRHICAKCWLGMKKMASHPEGADNCPLKDQES